MKSDSSTAAASSQCAVDGKAQFSMLGLGDIVIPGIFVAIVLRYDVAHAAQRARYFYRRGQGAERVGPCAGWDAAYDVAFFAWFVPSVRHRLRKLSAKYFLAALCLPAARLPAMRRAWWPRLW